MTRLNERSSSVTLKLEGQIVSEWVTVLERECLKELKTNKDVFLDFLAVTFIDGQGIAALKQLFTKKIKIVNCPDFIWDMLNDTTDS